MLNTYFNLCKYTDKIRTNFYYYFLKINKRKTHFYVVSCHHPINVSVINSKTGNDSKTVIQFYTILWNYFANFFVLCSTYGMTVT